MILYIYIYIEREREREREPGGVTVGRLAWGLRWMEPNIHSWKLVGHHRKVTLTTAWL